MKLEEFNKKDKKTAKEILFTICSSRKWTSLLMEYLPFRSEKDLISKATAIWYDCTEEDWLEAFGHHPKIGDFKNLEEKFTVTKEFAGSEQAGVFSAESSVIEDLAKANKLYEEKFGFIFIVCATGKSAVEMLRSLNNRIKNTYHEELNVAMGEQHKITIIRLKKLLDNADWQWMKMSQLTTHVLDTSMGKPAKDLSISLQQQHNGSTWQTMAQGITNEDGRITDLLPPEKLLIPGNYKLVFETGAYFNSNKINGFYPEVEIQFTISEEQHYHVPLLLNPFGYATYRGS